MIFRVAGESRCCASRGVGTPQPTLPFPFSVVILYRIVKAFTAKNMLHPSRVQTGEAANVGLLMERLYERVIEVLGKPHDNDVFRRFLEDMGDREREVFETKTSCSYDYPHLCFFIHVDKRQDQIKSVSFHDPRTAIECGYGEQLAGMLPAGIEFGDERAVVSSKLKAKPVRSGQCGTGQPKDLEDVYDAHPLELCFYFSGKSNELTFLRVSYIVDVLPPEPSPPEPDTHLTARSSPALRAVIEAARDECRRLRHSFLGTEQLLLGLLAEHEGVAAAALADCGVTRQAARQAVEEIIGAGMESVVEYRFTPRAKWALQGAVDAADRLGDKQVDTGHLLIALLEAEESVAIRVLENLGVSLADLRQRVSGS